MNAACTAPSLHAAPGPCTSSQNLPRRGLGLLLENDGPSQACRVLPHLNVGGSSSCFQRASTTGEAFGYL